MAWKAPMILATGNKRGRPGFTLIEIVLVLGLIALAGSVVMVNFLAFTDRGAETDPAEALRGAVREARFQAAAERVETRLSFDKENGSLRIEPGDTRIALNADFGATGPGEIRFFLVPPGQGLGPLPKPDDTRLLAEAVRFAPDRSSSPFAVEIDNGRERAERLVFDPFSSIQINSGDD